MCVCRACMRTAINSHYVINYILLYTGNFSEYIALRPFVCHFSLIIYLLNVDVYALIYNSMRRRSIHAVHCYEKKNRKRFFFFLFKINAIVENISELRKYFYHFLQFLKLI